jgi:uncharacterized protein YlzI (FlbEa/FlbD family)
MPLIKLSRINKGGDLVINSDHILFVEVEAKTTTIHMTGNLLFSVEESPDVIATKVEAFEAARMKGGDEPGGCKEQ